MKKLILSMAMIAGATTFAQVDIKQKIADEAQEQSQEYTKQGVNAAAEKIANGDFVFGIRANALINSSSLGNLSDVKKLSESGFNIGVAAKIDLGSNFSVTPELYYTKLGVSRIDLPILFGYEITNGFAIIAGPALMYGFSSDSKEEGKALVGEALSSGTIDVKALSSKLNFGYQGGLQASFSNFVISAKYEGSLSSQVVDLINKGTGQNFSEKVKTSVISLGVGYNFGG